MKQLDQRGNTGLIVALSITVVFLLATAGFAFWAYGSRQDYKNNTDKKIAAAVEIAKSQTASAKDNEFAEVQKSPVRVFKGPSAYGSVSLSYPKTWNAYADISGRGSAPVDAYFNPTYVAGTQTGSTYALRLQITNDSYDNQLRQFDGKVKNGRVKIKPYNFPNVKGVVGVRVEGEITSKAQGVMIIVPMRDKALKLWTETDQYQTDFNKYVLSNFKFSP
jgi:hypothetical protein